MNWILWLLIANGGIFFLEWAYRTAYFTNFWSSLYILIIPILMGQLGLFYGFKYAPSLFIAGTVFTLTNILLRIINSLILGEAVGVQQIVALLLVILATVILKI